MVASNLAVVKVVLAVSILPRVILARTELEPGEKASHRDFRSIAPVFDKIYHGVSQVRLYPPGFQSSPRLFFSAR